VGRRGLRELMSVEILKCEIRHPRRQILNIAVKNTSEMSDFDGFICITWFFLLTLHEI